MKSTATSLFLFLFWYEWMRKNPFALIMPSFLFFCVRMHFFVESCSYLFLEIDTHNTCTWELLVAYCSTDTLTADKAHVCVCVCFFLDYCLYVHVKGLTRTLTQYVRCGALQENGGKFYDLATYYFFLREPFTLFGTLPHVFPTTNFTSMPSTCHIYWTHSATANIAR